MIKQVKEMYKITALTNLHVGSGDQNYGIVDKLVQRDPLTQFPIIHASSLKGALKIYCKEVLGLTEGDNEPLTNSFGDDYNNKGQDKYFSAHLLTIPVRSNVKPYFRATCPIILKEIIELLDTFGISNSSKLHIGLKQLSEIQFEAGKQFVVFDDTTKDCLIEEYEIKPENFSNQKEKLCKELVEILNYKKEDFILIQDDVFMDICENLPVVARNRLDNKKNLWYEELIPRQSEFYFFYVGNELNRNNILFKIVENSKKDIPVQIGANASIGYGYCKIDKIS